MYYDPRGSRTLEPIDIERERSLSYAAPYPPRHFKKAREERPDRPALHEEPTPARVGKGEVGLAVLATAN